MVDDNAYSQLDVIRHGEHVLGNVVCGTTDPELTRNGWQQMSDRCLKLTDAGLEWDVCLTSPRKRCAQFARSLSESMGIDCHAKDELAEVDFGRWEAMTFEEIHDRYPGQWQSWMDNPEHAAPHGGERYGDFLRRIAGALDSLFREYAGQRMVLFAHGGVIRALLFSTLQLHPAMLPRFMVPHACHSRIRAYHRRGEPDWLCLEQHNSAGA